MRASLRTIPLADPYTVDSVITLDQIRPGPRPTNDYVDSLRAAATLPIKPHIVPQSHALVEAGGNHPGGVSPAFVHGLRPPVRAGSAPVGRVGGGVVVGSEGSPRPFVSPSSVVSHQPVSKSYPLKKNGVDSLDDNGVNRGGDAADSRLNGDAAGTNHQVGGGGGIICERCRKCQCNDCTDSKPLFSHWCCGNVCEVSPEKVVDGCTCFCCVKCIMYHFGNEEDYDNPCGCCSSSSHSHCLRRWTLMSAMSLCLPCLCAYWPARGCLAACTAIYNRCWRGRKGCNCQCNNVKLDSDTKSSVLSRGSGGVGSGGTSGGGGGTSKNSQSRRLLIESDSSSTST